MTEKYNSIRWFLRELPRLREAGVVDDAALQKLREHYIDRLSSRKGPREYFVLVMGIVGAAMLAAGAILAINYNWDMFTNLNRCIIGAIPLAVGFIWGIIALCRNNNRGEREGAAIVSAGGIATLIAVVSQVYHVGGDFSDYMLLVLALSLPLVYIFNSIGLATMYVLGLFFIIGNSHSEPLRQYIINDMERGGTYIKASGMYSKDEKEMIFLVVSRREVAQVQRKIREIDPKVFLVVTDAYDTYGEGFKPLPSKGEIQNI